MANAELRRRMDELPGWLSYEEGETLFDFAKACTGRGVIVEIGSWRGKSTTCLGLGSKAGKGVRIFAVDRHTEGTFPDWKRNMEAAEIDDLVTPIKGLSQELAAEFDEPIELLFIDGAHQYELVKQDFDRWVPKVLENGIVAMHDTTSFDGVKRVAEDEMYRSHRFKDVRFVYSTLTVGRKVAENTGADRARNMASLLVMRAIRHAMRLRGKEHIPKPVKRAGRRILRGIQ